MQRLDYVLATIGLIIFLFFAAVGMDKPGVSTAEGQLAIALAAPMTFPFHEAPTLTIFGVKLPLLLQPHIGCPLSIIYKPLLMASLPYNAVTIRVVTVFFGAVALAGAYFLARYMFAAPIAGLATFLYAVDPNQIFNSRCDWSHTTVMNVAKTWAIYLFLQGMQGSSMRALFLSGFLVGVSLWDKLSFAWLVIAFGIALLILKRKELFAMTLQKKLVFCSGGVVGAAPLIIANIPSCISILSFFLVGPPTTFETRWHVFLKTLDGTALNGVYNAMPPWAPPLNAFTVEPLTRTTALMKSVELTVQPNPAPVLLLVSIASLVALWTILARKKESAGDSAGRLDLHTSLIMTLILAIVLGLLPLTMRATYSPTHFFLLYPFMQYLLAFSFVLPFLPAKMLNGDMELNASKPAWRAAQALSAIAFLWLSLSLLSIDYTTWDQINRFGGRSIWSDCNVELADLLVNQKAKYYVPMDVNIWPQLYFLSKGRLNGDEYFWPVINSPKREDETQDQADLKHMKEVIAPFMPDLSETIFIFHAPESTQLHGLVATFERVCSEKGLREVEIATIKQRDGLPVYRIIKLESKL